MKGNHIGNTTKSKSNQNIFIKLKTFRTFNQKHDCLQHTQAPVGPLNSF